MTVLSWIRWIALGLLIQTSSAAAQQSFHWRHLEVDLEYRDNGDVWVTERHELEFVERRPKTHRHRFPVPQSVRVQGVIVSEGERVLTHETGHSDRQFWIEWPNVGEGPGTVTYTLKYTVVGAGKLAEFSWEPIPFDRAARTDAARVRLRFVDAGQLRGSEIAVNGVPSVETRPDDRTIVYDVNDPIPENVGLQIDIENPLLSTLKQLEEMQETLKRTQRSLSPETDDASSDVSAQSYVGWALMVLGVGFAVVIMVRARQGSPNYPELEGEIREPPSDLPAVAVSMLETGDVREETVLSAIVEMLQCGTLAVHWIVDPTARTIPYLFSAKPSDHPWERELQKALPEADQPLAQYHMGTLSDRFGELVGQHLFRRGLFNENPVPVWQSASRLRKQLRLQTNAAASVCSAGVALWMFDSGLDLAGYACGLLIAGIIGVRFWAYGAFRKVGQPVPTQAGSKEISAWRAFEKYLAGLGESNRPAVDPISIRAAAGRREANPAPTATQFDDYLPFAAAFGRAEDWIRIGEQAGFVAPKWINYPHEEGSDTRLSVVAEFFDVMCVAFGFRAENEDED